MNFEKFIPHIFSILTSLLIFVGLLILTACMGISVMTNLASGHICELVLLYASPIFLMIATLIVAFLTILLTYTCTGVIYSSLGLPPIRFKMTAEVLPAKIIEVIPTEKEEWKGIMSELKYGWKILGMTEKQIHRQELILSISLAWGKVESWIRSVWIWIVQYL
jgi:hypothetical protein